MKNPFLRAKQIITSPKQYFSNLKEEGIVEALLYALVLGGIAYILSFLTSDLSSRVYYELFARHIPGVGSSPPEASLFGSFSENPVLLFLLVFQLFVGVASIIFGTFFGSALLFVWFIICKESPDYFKMYKTYVYSMTPGFVFGWIPGVNLIVGIYNLVVLVIASKVVFGLSHKKAMLMLVLPYFIILILTAVLFFVIVYVFSNYEILANMIEP